MPANVMAAPTEPGELVNPLRSASSCRNCHAFENLPGDEDQPLYASTVTWQGSMMANSARDPVFWAGVAVASQDEPEGTALCIRCHSPKAFLEGRGESIEQAELTEDDQQGIVCELCHRMVDEGVIGNAQYTVDDILGPAGNVPRRGPWDYAAGEPDPPHDWAYDTYLGTSALCGTCHDVTTARTRLDDDGQPMDMLFNEQRTYREWANSRFAVEGPEFRSCQDCHMPEVTDVVGCTQRDAEDAHPFGRRHDLAGANRFMVEVMRSLYGSAGEDVVDDEAFDFTLDRIDELLAASATLSVEAPASVDLGLGLSGLEVTVTNETGHKLPSGYSEGRQMWLEVTATYADQVVYRSGHFEPGVGVEQDPQLRLYQGLAEEYATGIQQHLLLNDHWIEDTRIPPAGMVADPQTDPVGDRYTLLDDGTWPHYDVAPYAFEASEIQDVTPEDPSDDQLHLTVRLLYLINTPDYIQQLADDNRTNEAGMELLGLFGSLGGAPPMVLAEQSLDLPIDGFATLGGSTGTSSTSSGAGTTGAATTTGTSSDEPTSGGAGDDVDLSGCGCGHGPRGWTPMAMLTLFGLALRRRRGRISTTS